MIEIHLYGKLRRFNRHIKTGRDNVARLSPEPDDTIASVLSQLEIPVEEIYSIFFNSKLLAARTGMARWIGYQQVRGNPFDWDLNITVQSGDRIGLFGRDMAALVV